VTLGQQTLFDAEISYIRVHFKHINQLSFNLFNDAVSVSFPVAFTDRMVANNELGKIRKQVGMAWFKVLWQHLPGVTEEKHKNTKHKSLDSKGSDDGV
jgi:hypothetical protein